MDNWYMAWQLTQSCHQDLLDSIRQSHLIKQQATKRISWPQRALALLGMR
jgi:hypothetical protein